MLRGRKFVDQQEDLADVDTDASSAPAFSRRGLIAGIAGIGAVGATTGLLAACAPEDKVGVGAGAGTPDSSRIVLGGQPILDTDFPDGATPLAPLKDRVLALKARFGLLRCGG